MRSAFAKDIVRSIRGSMGRFLAIMGIVALGCGFYAGLQMCGPDMRADADALYDGTNLWDVRLISTLGFSDDDVERVRAVEGVEHVMPSLTCDAMARLGTEQVAVRISSIDADAACDSMADGLYAVTSDDDDYLNRPRLVDGRWPKERGECVVSADVPRADYGIGDTVELLYGSGDLAELLDVDELSIVGTVSSSNYPYTGSFGSTNLGSGMIDQYLFVAPASLAKDAPYTEIYLTVRGAREELSESDAYERVVDATKGRLEDLRSELARERRDDVRREAQEQLDEKWDEYDREKAKADRELADAEAELADAAAKIADGERELADGEAQYRDGVATYERERAATQKKLDDAAAQLDRGQKELDASRETWRKGRDELLAQLGAESLGDARTTLEAQRDQLTAQQAELETQRAGLAAQRADLEAQAEGLRQQVAGLEQLMSAFESRPELVRQRDGLAQQIAAMKEAGADTSELEAQLGQLDAALAAVDAAIAASGMDEGQARAALDQANAGISQLEEGIAQIDAGIAQIDDGLSQLADGLAQVGEGLGAIDQVEDGARKLDEGKAKLDAGRRELAQGRATAARELARGQQELDDAAAKLEDARAELEDGRAQYADGLREYEEGKAEADERFADALEQLQDAQREIDEVELPDIYALDRTQSEGAATYHADAGRIDSIADVFPFIFFLVAALVSLTTMTRMVEDDRVLIGTYKALGYGTGAIAAKYLAYAGIAGVVGATVGIVILSQVLPFIVMSAYSIIYTVPLHPFPLPINLGIALTSGGLGVGVTLLATWGAVVSSLREVPATLMLPRAPKAGKRILLERIIPVWRRLSFTWKVTFRNLFRYKRRFLMTVIGISGCTALLLVGFGLHDSIWDIIDCQYGPIIHFDTTVGLDDEAIELDVHRVVRCLEDSGEVTGIVRVQNENMQASADGYDETIRVNVVVPRDAEAMARVITFRNRLSGAELPLDDDAVLVTEKLALKYGLAEGDQIVLYDQDDVGNAVGEGHRLRVTGVAENYVGNLVYVGRDAYETLDAGVPVFGTIYASTTPDEDVRKGIADELHDMESVSTVIFSDETINMYRRMLSVVDMIVVVLIVSAAALAYIVLYNLTNINIGERIREIASLKVLGFTRGEVYTYIFREVGLLALIGDAVGLALGIVLERFVVTTAEVDYVMFGRTIHPPSFVYAFALTMLFTGLVVLTMRRRLDRVDMVESLKSVD